MYLRHHSSFCRVDASLNYLADAMLRVQTLLRQRQQRISSWVNQLGLELGKPHSHLRWACGFSPTYTIILSGKSKWEVGLATSQFTVVSSWKLFLWNDKARIISFQYLRSCGRRVVVYCLCGALEAFAASKQSSRDLVTVKNVWISRFFYKIYYYYLLNSKFHFILR